jgi:cellulose synthase/poly-beta-1,6-N-acetylglucosamine synthase-like glycosyltransferase
VGALRRVLRGTSLLVAVLDLLFWLVLGLDWFRGVRKIAALRNVEDEPVPGTYPALSVIVPARDEERGVGESVRSMLAQDYPGPLEVVVVDDRSTDRTGEILDSLKREYPGLLSVLHVTRLPDGWLGKNHALALGFAETRGEWLLFTDADVRLAPECVRKAVEYATENGLDHLTLAPEILSSGALLGGFVATFELIFVSVGRPWRAKDPQAKEHVGVGAFNLVRREAYVAAGTHHAIRMRPDDDMKLAKLLKREGFKQDVASGAGLVRVEWHQSVRGALRGLSKSIFPVVDYRLDQAALATFALPLTNVFPFVGFLLTRGATRAFCGLNVALILLIYAYQERYKGVGAALLHGALHPLSVSLFVYAILRSTCTILVNGGIEWCGTRYPLEQLKENVV